MITKTKFGDRCSVPVSKYIVDTLAELSNIKPEYHSSAIVLEKQAVYYYNGSGNWVPMG